MQKIDNNSVNFYWILTKVSTEMCLISPYCVPVSARSEYVFAFYVRKCKVNKINKKKIFWNFACLYLGIGWCNLLRIWYVDSPSSGASQQQIWLNLGMRSQSYRGVKIMFSSSCQYTHGASWVPRHTTMCLDKYLPLC